MKRAISVAFVISTVAMTQLHAGGHPGGERPFLAPPPPVRQMPQPRAPEPRIEPERPVETTASGDVRKAEQQGEMAAAAEKEWAKRPRSEEEKNNLTESRPQEQSTPQLQQKQAAQQQQRIAQEQTTAPPKYGTAEENVSLDPNVPGKGQGIKFFSITF